RATLVGACASATSGSPAVIMLPTRMKNASEALTVVPISAAFRNRRTEVRRRTGCWEAGGGVSVRYRTYGLRYPNVRLFCRAFPGGLGVLGGEAYYSQCSSRASR